MAHLAGSVGFRARYREEKRMSLLRQPLRSEGTLHYLPPARIARIVVAPVASKAVFDGQRLRMQDGVTERVIEVKTNPLIRALLQPFLDLLAGHRAALERTFTVAFNAASDAGWSLTLVPRSPQLLKQLKQLQFSGQGFGLNEMRMSEANGDETTTWFSEVDTMHRYGAAEVSEIFGKVIP